MLLRITSTSGLPRGSGPLGSLKDLMAGRICPLGYRPLPLRSTGGDVGSDEWTGQALQGEGGFATLVPRRWQQQ